jgi:hypothetical protein
MAPKLLYADTNVSKNIYVCMLNDFYYSENKTRI